MLHDACKYTKKIFVRGFTCFIINHKYGGHSWFCAYVRLPKRNKINKKMRLQKHLSGTPYSFPLLQNLGAPGGITFNGSIVASDNDTVIGWDYDHYWHRLRASEGQPVTEEEVIKDIKRFAVRFAKLCGINRK